MSCPTPWPAPYMRASAYWAGGSPVPQQSEPFRRLGCRPAPRPPSYASRGHSGAGFARDGEDLRRGGKFETEIVWAMFRLLYLRRSPGTGRPVSSIVSGTFASLGDIQEQRSQCLRRP